MGKLIALSFVAGCGSPPTVELAFEAAGAGDACIDEESHWFESLAHVWISVEEDGDAVAHGCVHAGDVGGWDALEAKLRHSGDLVTNLDVGPAYQIYLVGITDLEACDEDGPATPFDFCAFTLEPVRLSADHDVRADLERYCQSGINQEDCWNFAANRRGE